MKYFDLKCLISFLRFREELNKNYVDSWLVDKSQLKKRIQ